MKNIKINLKTLVALIASASLITGCAKISDFGDTNQNPDAVTLPVPSALITSAESSLPGFSSSTITFLYCQYGAETQYTDASLYSLPQFESTGTYVGPLMDLQVILNTPLATVHEKAVAKILKSYYIMRVTDRWGDVPYSEALQGAGNLAPKYDMQEDIYKAMFTDLADAITELGTVSAPLKGDIVYGGNVAKWKKAANSIRLIASLRLSKKVPAIGGYAQMAFEAAATDPNGIIASNADNFSLTHPGGPQGSVFQNPWYRLYFARDDYAISKTMTDCLTGLGDNRGTAFGSNGIGFPYGLTRDLAISFTNSVGNGHGRVLAVSKRGELSNIVMIGAAQSLLAWAEGLQLGWASNGTAKAAYDAGVAASFGQWGLTMPATYLTTGPANFTSGSGVAAIGQNAAPWDAVPAAQNAATSTPLKRIQLQRWLAAYPDGDEGWAEWRRTGVPDLRPSRFATNTGGQIPRRYVYGSNEAATNPAQLAIAVGRLTGGDTQDAKIWWDQ
ncbi:MAG: SusD/RagB family nutrient-binding outer membrane lipoprotein [Chitinophagaceae bacterium]|nr:SusD/RagB family nutrient-binding outer membrane lipoprotein [Chitinophagaceae bacterium]